MISKGPKLTVSLAAVAPKVEVKYVQSIFAVSYSPGWVAHSRAVNLPNHSHISSID